MKTFKKFIAFLMTIISIFSVINTSLSVFAEDINKQNNLASIKVVNANEISSLNLRDTNLLCIEGENSTDILSDNITDLLDNNVNLFLSRDNIEANKECMLISKVNNINTNALVGIFYYAKDAYKSFCPVYAMCLYEEGFTPNCNESKNDIAEIVEHFEYTPENLLEMSEKLSGTSLPLKATTAYGNISPSKIFYDEQSFCYLFKKSTNLKWNTSSTLEKYTRVGSADSHMVLYSIGHNDTDYYNGALIYTTVGITKGKNYCIKNYDIDVGSFGTKTLQVKKPSNTSDNKVSVSYSTGLSSDGKITTSTTTSFSVNPDGQTFTLHHDEPDTYSITGTPASEKNGVTWEAVTSATICSKKGTTAYFGTGISNVKIKGTIFSYSISETGPWHMVGFKNHSLVV